MLNDWPAANTALSTVKIAAATRRRHRALQVRRRAVTGVNAVVGRRAGRVGRGVFPRAGLGLRLPADAAAIQSEGRVSVARTVPLSAVATEAGGAPVRIFNTALVPMVVSIASNIAFRTATESCKAISNTPI
jgi:hypothetical protein